MAALPAPPAGSLPAPGPHRPVGGAGCDAQPLAEGLFFRTGPSWGSFARPGCPVPAERQEKEEGREGCGDVHLRSGTLPELSVVFQTTSSPSPLCSRLRERGGLPSLQLGSTAQLSPFPGVTFLISFFLDYLFHALVRLGKSIPRFPLPCSLSRGLEGVISQLDFNYPFADDDAEPRAAAWAAGLSPPVSRPAVPPCRTRHLLKTD